MHSVCRIFSEVTNASAPHLVRWLFTLQCPVHGRHSTMPCCGAYVFPVHSWHGVCPGRVLWVPGGHASQRDASGVNPGRQAAITQATWIWQTCVYEETTTRTSGWLQSAVVALWNPCHD